MDADAGDSVPVGQLLDQGGLRAQLADGELLVGAVAVLKVVSTDGRVVVRSAWTESLDWVNRLGMLEAAAIAERPGPADIS